MSAKRAVARCCRGHRRGRPSKMTGGHRSHTNGCRDRFLSYADATISRKENSVSCTNTTTRQGCRTIHTRLGFFLPPVGPANGFAQVLRIIFRDMKPGSSPIKGSTHESESPKSYICVDGASTTTGDHFREHADGVEFVINELQGRILNPFLHWRIRSLHMYTSRKVGGERETPGMVGQKIRENGRIN